jgi:nucleoid-associated protein YgaU
MVPMIDVRDNCSEITTRPQLVLKDWTQEQPAPPCSRRNPFARFENVLLTASASAALIFFAANSGASLFHSIQQNYTSQTLPQTVIISKAVKRGDTLTSLAQRYGNPNTYILEREDQIARANQLTGTTPLLPGQHLQIPVTNPAVIAQIVRSSHRPLMASR